ncbi:MAG: squalene synthase HpnC [Ignavibacteria bacterium GWB2_35_12]|nr:MAG: squalene synthase HpnC [Ignavibacteria bacterium GWA2_35_8]OGU39315.1 MAG: squalene synthase HpnC [Ignavibacteria bacterium GWB2_35_12]OGU92844.1 MAG: squalene synthase HpnC [Ignavibacteria bacterium RIFOXYA2_FULL_35_10]OGV21198.1 MAG: squalene synthase HpnC [Ignavibacteria bacterium RIFOXYC2_FULL_35_21]
MTISHYENFPVASFLVPKSLRKYVNAIYTYARIADDIGDELTSIGKEKRLKALDDYEQLLLNNEGQQNNNPVFLAIHQTMKDRNIPVEPLQKLLIAFRRDVEFVRANTIDDLLNYCSYSANPVGELVLRLFNNYNDITAPLSDKICTGLQLANFWQDLSIDLKNGRVYIPLNILENYNINQQNIYEKGSNENLFNCLNELYLQTEKYLRDGYKLIEYLNNYRLKLEIKASALGGLEIIEKSRNLGTDIIKSRPKLSKLDFMKIFIKAVIK